MYLRELLRKKDHDATLYVIGVGVALILAAAYTAVQLLGKKYPFFALMNECGFKRLTGLNCPGCGGTRSFIYLIHGHIIKSILYYPFVPYAVTTGLIFYVSQTLRFITRGRVKGIHFKNSFIIIGVILITGNWIIKNIFILLK